MVGFKTFGLGDGEVFGMAVEAISDSLYLA